MSKQGKTTRRLSVGALCVAAIWALLGSWVNVGATPVATQTITRGETPERVEVLDAMVANFDSNGLQLPTLEIEFHNEKSECGGHEGLFQPRFSPWRVLICTDKPFVLPHELAHSWAQLNLTDAERDDYVAARSLHSWSDPQASRAMRGTEDAAFIIQQNLTISNVPAASRTWQERMVAFEFLTGMPSPLRTV